MKLLSSIDLFDVVDGGTVGVQARIYIWGGAPLFEAAADEIPWASDFGEDLLLRGVLLLIGRDIC